MLGLLAFILPFGLAGAMSPMMLTEQTVLLTEPDGRRVAERYAAGAMLVLLAFAVALATFGRSIALPQKPHLDAGLDLTLGALLGALAALLWHGRGRERAAKPPKRAIGARAALAFGAFSMATNVTTLAAVVPAVKEVAASHVGILGRTVALVTLVALASAPAWAPVALTAAAPGPASRALNAFSALVSSRGRLISVISLAAFGLLLIVRGVVRIVTV